MVDLVVDAHAEIVVIRLRIDVELELFFVVHKQFGDDVKEGRSSPWSDWCDFRSLHYQRPRVPIRLGHLRRGVAARLVS